MPQANEPTPIERTLEPVMRDTTIETLGGGSEPVRAGEWIYSTASQRFAVADEIVRDLFRRRASQFVDDAAVGEEDDAIGVTGRDRIVGDGKPD